MRKKLICHFNAEPASNTHSGIGIVKTRFDEEKKPSSISRWTINGGIFSNFNYLARLHVQQFSNGCEFDNWFIFKMVYKSCFLLHPVIPKASIYIL